MMICPESYYEMNLKGKDEKHLRSAIRGLKNEMGHLKNVMENPNYEEQDTIHPSEDVRISCIREYIARAIQAVEEMGAEYQLSKAELKAINFQNNLEHISKITFEIGCFFEGMTKHVVEFKGDKAILKSSKSHNVFQDKCILEEKSMDKEEIIELLSHLYIGEWRKNYSPSRFGYYVMDGTQWSVSFEYSNGHKIMEFSGSNDYPYNFDEFLGIFESEEDMESEEV